MRQRRVRSQIYLPIVRWGVNDEDWTAVYIIALSGYAVPFALDVNYRGFPLAILFGPAAFVGAVLFFNWTRRGRRGRWLQHVVKSWFTPARRRRRTPRDAYSRPHRRWIRPQET